MLYTYEAGQPGKPAILFLHGGGLSSKSWLPVIQRLPDFHCLAPDLPEQGRSLDIPYTVDGSASEVAEIIRQKVPAQKVHLVALSLGGPVALTLLRTSPELIDHTLLSGSSGHFSKILADFGKSTIWVYKFYKQDYLVRETIRQHGIDPQYTDLIREDLVHSISPAFMRHYMGDLANWELPEKIDTPLLILVGAKEMVGAAGISRGYLKRYPSAQGRFVEGAKHAWCLQFPDLFAETVRAWVTDQPLPAALDRPLK
jgi:pimeloyl-ACP methyl ester carboxylesterase